MPERRNSEGRIWVRLEGLQPHLWMVCGTAGQAGEGLRMPGSQPLGCAQILRICGGATAFLADVLGVLHQWPQLRYVCPTFTAGQGAQLVIVPSFLCSFRHCPHSFRDVNGLERTVPDRHPISPNTTKPSPFIRSVSRGYPLDCCHLAVRKNRFHARSGHESFPKTTIDM